MADIISAREKSENEALIYRHIFSEYIPEPVTIVIE